MKTRVAASTLLGVALVALVALATVAVALVVWDRAKDTARVENDRALQQSQEALQTSVGRLLATMRGADGLVGERGDVDATSFQAFARAVSVLPAAETLALAEPVSGTERAEFETRTGIRIVEPERNGVSAPAAARPAYLPIVSVWPATEAAMATLGLDLLVDPVRRAAIERAREAREAVFTDLVPLPGGRQGFLAFKPLYAPSGHNGAPVGYVTASFGADVVAEIFRTLPPDVRAVLRVDGALVYRSESPPTDGVVRTLELGGRRWELTAQVASPSRRDALAILVAGFTLAALLAAFTGSRMSFERRLVTASTAEREARERAEVLARHAAHLAGAATAEDVATATVACLRGAGVEIAAVHVLHGEVVERLATSGVSNGQQGAADEGYPVDADLVGAEAIRTGETVEVADGAALDERFPASADVRRRAGVESVLAVPLRSTAGRVSGVLIAASRDRGRLTSDRRLLVRGMAEQCGLALDRARLQAVDDQARRRANILHRLGASLAAAVVLKEAADACIPSLFEGFDADVCLATLACGDELELLSVAREGPRRDPGWTTIARPAWTSATAAVSDGRLVEAHGPAQLAELYGAEAARALAEQGVGSAVLVPLPRAGDSIGLAFRGSRSLGPDDRALLESIGDEVAKALARAALFEAERDARRRAELMERNAGRLAAVSTAADVARVTVEDFEAFGADVVYIWRYGNASMLEALASTEVPEETRRRFDAYPVDRPGLVTEALRTGRPAVATATEFDERYPDAAAERRRLGFEAMVALPLRAAHGGVVGALFVGSKERGWLDSDRRQVLLGIAEQTGVALERAQLFETEREARLLAELLERNAAHLAAAVTVDDVAASAVGDLEQAGFPGASIRLRLPEGVELAASAGAAGDEYESALSAEVLETGEPAESTATHQLAVPLRAADRRLIGVLEVLGSEAAPLAAARRQVVLGVAEQCGLALERAQLQADAEANAADAVFLAHLADVLEQATTVGARARRLVELLTEQRATFAAIHLLDDGALPLVAMSGSRPSEAGDDEEWSRIVQQAIATGRAVSPGDGPQPSGAATIVLPLRARGNVIGALTMRSAADARWRPSISPTFAREIAQRAAVRIDNAALYERERDVSHSLQLGLLGGAPPDFDGVVITAAYRAGTETLEVGGDWYDAFPLPSGSIALVVGDVVGHGLEAAVAMGQLRGAVGALAQTGPPGVILERLDAFVENVPSAATATLAYVELDPATGRLRYACAGHPPPLVVSADNVPRYLWDGRSAPLGAIPGEPRPDAADRLEPGETLVLYTDGLIERRTTSLDDGLDRLAQSASRRHERGAESLADEISDELLEGVVQDDDVCVLTVHFVGPPATFSHSLLAAPAELALLRRRLRAWLERHALAGETMNSTVLAVSEAAANAIEHGYGSNGHGVVTVDAQLEDSRLDITVRDHGTWRERTNGGERGRGLPIIEAVVDEVSIDHGRGGTTVRMRRSTHERALT